jgi:DNA-binding NarL/FixJ family response regulator
MNLEQIAERMELTRSSIRTYLRNIFAKTSLQFSGGVNAVTDEYPRLLLIRVDFSVSESLNFA